MDLWKYRSFHLMLFYLLSILIGFELIMVNSSGAGGWWFFVSDIEGLTHNNLQHILVIFMVIINITTKNILWRAI